MLDYDKMYEGLIEVTKLSVGSSLSTMKTQTSTTPSVFRARTGRPQPDLPYITLDLESTILPSGWLLNSYVDSVSNLPTYEIFYEVFFTWRCFGDNSMGILQQLHSYLSAPSVQGAIREKTPDLGFHNRGEVLSTPSLATTDYLDSASLTVSFYCTDTIVDPLQTGDYILSLEGEGTLITGKNGDIPVPIAVNLP